MPIESEKPPYQAKVLDGDGYLDRIWLNFLNSWMGRVIAGAVQSVTGTAGRILVSGTATNPIINLDPAYVASASQGGTGQSSYLLGDTIYANNPATLAKLPGTTAARRSYLGQFGTGTASAAPEWVTDPVFNVKDYGAKGDGVTDDTAAIQRAIAAVSAAGGGRLFFPKGTYLISSSLSLPSYCTAYGDGVASVIKSTAATLWNDTGLLEVADGISNVVIADLSVDGDAIGNATQTGADGTCTRGRSFGIKITGLAHDIHIDRVKTLGHQAFNNTTTGGCNGGDGIYIVPNVSGIPYDIFVDGTISDANYRQGGTCNGVDGLYVSNSKFTNTTGTNPGAGWDFEPDSTSHSVTNVHFVNTKFNGNQWGVAIYNTKGAVFRDFTFKGCNFDSNRDHGVVFEAVENGAVSFDGGTSYLNGGSGFKFGGGNSDAKISNMTISGNTEHGIDIRIGSRHIKAHHNMIALNGKHGILVDYASGGKLYHAFDNNGIWNNSQSSSGTYDGVNFVGNASHDDFTSVVEWNFIGNATQIGTSTQRDGVRINANATKVSVQFNRFYSNTGTHITNSSGDAWIEWNWNNGAMISGVAGSTQMSINSAWNFIPQPKFNGDYLMYTGGLTSGKLLKASGATGGAGNSLLSESGQQILHAGQEFDLNNSNSGGTNSINSQNTANAASTVGQFLAKVGGTSALAAPFRSHAGSSGVYWTIEPSTGDMIFAIGTTLGSGIKLRLTVAGDLKLENAGNGLFIKEGTNACMGLATLVAGVAVVSTTKVTANSRIFLTRQTVGGTPGTSVDVTARTAGTSFTITAAGSILDTSTVAWQIVEPA